MTKRRDARAALRRSVMVVMAALVAVTGLALLEALNANSGPFDLAVVILIMGLLGIGAGWVSLGLLDTHFDDLARMGQDLDIYAATGRRPSRWGRAESGTDELSATARAMGRAMARGEARDAQGVERLTSILGGIEDGLLAFTETGLISLANGPAHDRLGAEHTGIGQSVFAFVDHDALGLALATARASGHRPHISIRGRDGGQIEARLSAFEDGGALAFPKIAEYGAENERHGEPHVDLTVHDRAPDPLAFDEDCSLIDLPVVSLDLETTGLDVRRDRILSIGIVRIQSGHIYTATSLDLLVKPGIPIPERSINVHGITEEVIASAPDLPEVWDQISKFVDGSVIVGHQIGYDLAMLRAEAERHGLPAIDRPALDTMEMYSALTQDPRRGLDDAADALGVGVFGRHTALGDALVTGEVYLAMLRPLVERGVLTFGAACEIAEPSVWGQDT